MFYANNEQVKGIFLNGRNYNYLVYGFGKIIPEDRNAEQLNLNLAYKYLNQYRIEFGTVKDGYENALVSPRFDKPVNGVFHTPFTYYYGGNIISTKQVPVLITDGNYALSNALVYNDMNINGAINYFATNTDFQGHNVNVFPENDSFQVHQALLNYEMLNNCSNFDLNINTRFSKASSPTLYNCNNFSGNFRYVGNSDVKYPGFRGFLEDCKDSIFNIDCMNMHGGGSVANVTNFYNFSGIQGCNNIKLRINGSPWQAWVHPYCYSSNCNIATWYIVPGFDNMRDCNFELYIPRYADVEKSANYSILSNSWNCNVYFDGLNSNLYSFRNGGWGSFWFEDLNDCNLNLLLNNSNGLDYGLGNRLNNCNIYFNNMNLINNTCHCWGHMNNCNMAGSVIKADTTGADLVAYSTNVNLNVDASLTNNFSLLWNSSNINGNVILGNYTCVHHSNNLILYLHNGNTFALGNVGDSNFTLNNINNVELDGAYNTNFNLHNGNGYSILSNLNNVKFVERGGANYKITNIDNCYNSWIHANTVDGLLENVYDTRIELKNSNSNFQIWRANNCEITGFPNIAHYTTNCTFNASIPQAAFRNSRFIKWKNVWPHATPRGGDGWNTWYMTKAGLNSVDNLVSCYLNCNNGSLLAGDITYYHRNYMETNIANYYNGTADVDLTPYNRRITLNIDCSTLKLGITGQSDTEPLHGFEESSISAINIYRKDDGASDTYCVYARSNTRIYCEGFCNTTFVPNIASGRHPVILINNYQTINSNSRHFECGLTRIGRLTYQGGAPFRPNLNNGACLFINNALLDGAFVNNSLLFVGSNVTWTSSTKITIGNGLIVSKENWRSYEDEVWRHVDTGKPCWNVWDKGPWGSKSLYNFCTNI